MAVFDLHVHTVRGSSDSSLTPARLIEEAVRVGLDGVCLTEHSGGWEDGVFEETFESAGFTVVRGLEVATDMGHIVVFGLHSYVAEGMHDASELKAVVDRVGGVMIAAHPFRNLFDPPPYNQNLLFKNAQSYPRSPEEAARHPLFELVDDIEVANGANTEKENSFGLDVARELGMPGTGGSDAHSEHGLGRYVTVFEGEVLTEAGLVEAIRAGAYTPARRFDDGETMVYGRWGALRSTQGGQPGPVSHSLTYRQDE